MKFIFILALISFPLFAKPYKVKVFAEAGAEEKALEYIQNMRSMEPFKQLIESNTLIIETTPTPVSGINCRGGASGIARLAQCDLANVRAGCGDADLCPVYTSVPDIGAGGPKTPIVSSSFPWTTMLHEVVHAFGFTDEYAYTKDETKVYCPGTLNWHNGHSHGTKKSQEEVFKNKADAENACKKNISWCQEAIDSGAVVVQQTPNGKFKIGSPNPPSCPSVALGVYSGGSCQAKNAHGTFRPYFCPTVMGYPTLGEEYCAVTRRHKIIRNSPNLLPPLYQRAIFDKIVKESKTDNVQFQNRSPGSLNHHAYGIPEIDRLSGHNGEINLCLETQGLGNVNDLSGGPHVDCFNEHP